MADAPYVVSALKHRPITFREVLAQDHITRTLKHSLERGKVANAYIFAGSRGTGKTTTARLLAKALNCENLQDSEPCNRCDSCRAVMAGNHPDVLEVDAASNRGVEEIETLRENAQFAPSMGKYKIYIIDECHMLSTHANNALLKTLEEPPAHTRFIFATTELHKLLPTILSRCQLFRFRRIPNQVIVAHLKHILTLETGVEIAEPAELERILFLIACSSEGGLRDALVSLDQLLAFCSGRLRLDDVQEILGMVEFELIDRFVTAIICHDLEALLQEIEEISNRGREMEWFLKECLQYLRNLTVVKIAKSPNQLLDLPEDSLHRLEATAPKTTVEQILYITDQLWEAERRMRFSSESRMILEMAAIKAAKAGLAVQLTDLLQQLSSSGRGSKPAASPTSTTSSPAPVASLEKSSSRPEPPPLEHRPDSPPPKESAPEAAHAPSPAPGIPETSDLLVSSWNALLRDIEHNNPMLGAALEGSIPLHLQNETLTLAIPAKNSYSMKSLHKPVNQSYLQDKLKAAFGKALKIKYEPRDDLFVPKKAQPETIPPPSPDELRNQVEQNDMFSKIQSVLPGRIRSINPTKSSPAS